LSVASLRRISGSDSSQVAAAGLLYTSMVRRVQ
jgi:hypothetical protein